MCAGALAAVTSFLLSAKIGIAGSVIGVAVGSVVSAAASQIYKNMLEASKAKLREASPLSIGDLDGADAKAEANSDGTQKMQDAAVDATIVIGADGIANDDAANADSSKDGLSDDTVAMPASDETSVIRDVEGRSIRSIVGRADETTGDSAGASPKVSKVSKNSARAHMSPTSAQLAVERRSKRLAIIVAVVSALVAVGATAGVILLVTGGEGTDSVVRDIVHPNTSVVVPAPGPEDTSGTGYPSSPSGENSSSTSDENADNAKQDASKDSDNNSDGTGESADSTSNATLGNTSGSTGTDGSDSTTDNSGAANNGTGNTGDSTDGSLPSGSTSDGNDASSGTTDSSASGGTAGSGGSGSSSSSSTSGSGTGL